MTVKVLRPAAELSPEQAEFVADLRALLEDAIAGKVVGLVAITVTEGEECGYFLSGTLESIGETYLALHNLADMLRVGDLESMLGLEDE